jgi:hypothetical protein
MFQKLVNFQRRSGIASVVVMVCLAWAGMNFSSSAVSDFVDVEAALENAIAGSGSSYCFQAMRRCDGELTVYTCVPTSTAHRCGSFYTDCYWC